MGFRPVDRSSTSPAATAATVAVAATVALGLFSGCEWPQWREESSHAPPDARYRVWRSQVQRALRAAARPIPAHAVRPARCPAGLPSCRATAGRVVFLEVVDPDGDGDAHFVLIDERGITLPGVTVIDVRRGLRPHPMPGVGDVVSAAGQVQYGSYGQAQIHAVDLHVGSGG